MNKFKLIRIIKKLVIKIDFVLSNSTWCKWSCPALNGFFLIFSRIRFIDKNSNTKIAIDHASIIGWTKFRLAKYINTKEIIKPNSKLPPSSKNSLGNLKKEKLNNIKMNKGIAIIIKKNLKFSSGIKKYKIDNTDNDEKLSVPSNPSK